MTEGTAPTLPVEGEVLLPCPNPWCDAQERDGDYSPQVQRGNFGVVCVACTSCTMAGPTRLTEAAAIAAWNTRNPSTETIRVMDRHVLCLLIEEHCPKWDVDYGHPIGTQVEALADRIIAALSLVGEIGDGK